VRSAFRERGRSPRWEWIHDLYPDLAPALEACGIPPEDTPLMTVTAESFRPESGAGLTLRAIDADEDLAPLIRAQRRSFAMEDDQPSDAERSVVRAWIGRGGCFYVAEASGEVVGTGAYLPIEGVAEVAGIGTVPTFRHQGVGGAVTSALVRDCFARGCDCVFLTAGNEAAGRLYRRIGFEVIARGMAAAEP
jgi:ribosomal protein S18 acetylase RimI-like enzyme